MTTKEFREKQRRELENFAMEKAAEIIELMDSRALTKTALAKRMGWTRSMISRVFKYPIDYLNNLGDIGEEIR